MNSNINYDSWEDRLINSIDYFFYEKNEEWILNSVNAKVVKRRLFRKGYSIKRSCRIIIRYRRFCKCMEK